MARIRVISDNDYSGDPDGLWQLAHLLLSPDADVRLVIGSHLREGDPFDPSGRSADNAARKAREMAAACGRDGIRIVAGSNAALPAEGSAVRGDAVAAIVEEAMRDDPRPLYVACGGGLTEIASAWLAEPRIAQRLTVVWIGGPEYPGGLVPPGAMPVEYNTLIDPAAARVVFNDSDLPLWQVPRDAYRQALVSMRDLEYRVRPLGPLGELLVDSLEQTRDMMRGHGLDPGGTYILGDNPLVLLTALQSGFEPDPCSSQSFRRPRPRVRDDGTFDFDGAGPEVRVFTRLDVPLMMADLVALLAGH
ncbi:nucleoside hydrolase [Paractinoplanes toevensis]|uniref:nucleoside hydrolase n=1 Tax=Paractinoplanes toevensis TaxID=571911 RepID=UPI001BB331BD|nr:nucleoside hydrolase [Actinoplanes toevensis]